MELLNRPVIALMMLIGFIALAWHSEHFVEANKMVGYDVSAFEVLDRPLPLTQRQREGLKEIWASYLTESLTHDLPEDWK